MSKRSKNTFFRRFVFAIVIISLLIPVSVHAGGLTFGAKVGPMLLDIPNSEDPVNAGVAIGFEFSTGLGDFGMEGEFTTTTKDGKIADELLNIDTAGVYATYRSPGIVYLKGRAGYVAWDSGLKLGDSSEDESASMGLGLGLNLNILKFEVEYTQIDDDINYVSLAILF